MKVVVNKCWGGFSISKECAELMAQKGCEVAKAELEEYNKDPKDHMWYGYGYINNQNGYKRTSKFLVEAVEELGDKASGYCAELQIVEIPDDINWYIDDYDGIESIHEVHKSW